MKVFALMNYQYEDYAGGGASVVAIYSDFEKAFAKVKETFPKAKKNPQMEWAFPREPCTDSWLAIEEYEVQE